MGKQNPFHCCIKHPDTINFNNFLLLFVFQEQSTLQKNVHFHNLGSHLRFVLKFLTRACEGSKDLFQEVIVFWWRLSKPKGRMPIAVTWHFTVKDEILHPNPENKGNLQIHSIHKKGQLLCTAGMYQRSQTNIRY